MCTAVCVIGSLMSLCHELLSWTHVHSCHCSLYNCGFWGFKMIPLFINLSSLLSGLRFLEFLLYACFLPESSCFCHRSAADLSSACFIMLSSSQGKLVREGEDRKPVVSSSDKIDFSLIFTEFSHLTYCNTGCCPEPLQHKNVNSSNFGPDDNFFQKVMIIIIVIIIQINEILLNSQPGWSKFRLK